MNKAHESCLTYEDFFLKKMYYTTGNNFMSGSYEFFGLFIIKGQLAKQEQANALCVVLKQMSNSSR